MKYPLTARICFIIGLLLTLPAAFYFISMLAGAGLADFLIGLLREWGLLRWVSGNINLILVFAPLLAFLLNLFSMVKVNRRAVPDASRWRIRITRNGMNGTVILLSGLILLVCLIFIIRWETQL